MNAKSPTEISTGIARTPKRFWPVGPARWVGVVLLAISIGASCAISVFAQIFESAPRNVFRATPQVPKEVRRVAVLPISAERVDEDSDFGQESLQPVLVAELGKRGSFEVVVVTPEQLTQWTGKPRWSATEKLPARFLELLHDELDCDAVLFARLSRYKPYPPLAMGWTLELVFVDHSQICWAADEVFDMSERDVAVSAQRYGRRQFEGPDLHLSLSSISLSPRQFAQYSLATLLATLPTR